ncbi:MFS transporter [Rhodobacteraceae bacterium 2CG4]|uniref:MFS transporter n=1 Tax=Halovulum marinum TaxID=2662447 RepID=A0A6L5Z1G4_9RHOB|nr:MFS transporter [Halovulum marinum]MSU90338.1 MFS transporter [Halovulum marinum]
MSLHDPDTKRWKALALLCAAQFIVILDTSIIGVALPAIQADLGFTDDGLSWIFNAYVIAFGGLLLLGGKLADVFGARRIFLTGFGILAAASLVAGLADSQAVLLAGRALQGVGAALIAPAALSILMRLFGANPAELGRAFGFWGAAAAAGGTAGVFLGGVITEWLSWSWTFLVNVPLGLAVLAIGPAVLRPHPCIHGKVGIIDSALVTGAIVAAVYAIVTAEQVGWQSMQTLGLLSGALVLLAVFLAMQASSRTSLLPLRLFRAPGLAIGNLVMSLLGAAWIPLWFFLNLYLQSVLQLSAFGSGLALLPMTLVIMVFMVRFTGPLIGRYGVKRVMVTGLLALSAALGLLASIPADGTYLASVLPASLLAALGMSLAYIPITMTGMAGAAPEDTGLASGLINTTYQVGSALGLAIMVSVAAAQVTATSPETVATLLGYQAAFLGAALVGVLASLLALMFVRSGGTATEVAIG